MQLYDINIKKMAAIMFDNRGHHYNLGKNGSSSL